MQAAILDARAAAHGHEAVLVSHQLPIWITRLSAEKRSYLHDPRQRQCTLCSLTSFHFDERGLVRVSYSEPAGDMIPVRDKQATFSAGGAPRSTGPEKLLVRRRLSAPADGPAACAATTWRAPATRATSPVTAPSTRSRSTSARTPISFDGRGPRRQPAVDRRTSAASPSSSSVWGSWCAACRKEAPWVVGAAEELGDDVQFVGINIRDASTAQAQAFERRFGIDFPSFYSPDGEAFLAFPGVLSPRTIPAFVVLDAEGRVAASILGRLPSQQTLVDVADDVVDETRDG